MSNTVSPEVADALLDKLSTDDAFRAQFEKDPASAMASIGHTPPVQKKGLVASANTDPVMCMNLKDGKLADKETIKAGREKLRAALMRPLPQAMFDFCAS